MRNNPSIMNDIIPIDSEVTTFSEYLNNNCRGILSARFGDGKSFFLNEVKKQLSDKYLFLTIYPINYQVAENKDIFEYIKRDILLQILMTSEIDFSDEKYGFSLRLWGFFNQNGKDLVSDIVSLVASSLANIPQDAIKVFRDNIAKFKNFSKEVGHSQSDSIESYLDEFASQKGGIYEFDPISRIIYQLITDIKENSGRQVILVIEDMDRIDPAHIFRILNVFSAHWDMQDYSEQKLAHGNPLNKYNFDKILLVCHFQNIKNIFHHFYGERTDFTGYIHKFSSSTPYEYSLNDVIEEWILQKIPFSKDTFPAICKRLADLIMQKYKNCENIITNIRHITHFLTQSDYNIRKEDIPPYSWPNEYNGHNYYISTYNQVTHLLCILENFGISIDEFLDSYVDQFYGQLCQFIGQCWLIYPQLNIDSNSSKCRFRFSNCINNAISCEWDGYHTSLPCNAVKVDTHPMIQRFEIKWMQMDSLSCSSRLKELFPKQSFETILLFFKDYIY